MGTICRSREAEPSAPSSCSSAPLPGAQGLCPHRANAFWAHTNGFVAPLLLPWSFLNIPISFCKGGSEAEWQPELTVQSLSHSSFLPSHRYRITSPSETRIICFHKESVSHREDIINDRICESSSSSQLLPPACPSSSASGRRRRRRQEPARRGSRSPASAPWAGSQQGPGLGTRAPGRG